jgi:hypothetical protein
MLLWRDVLNVERRVECRLRQVTIFAAMVCTLSNETPSSRVHHDASRRRESRAFALKIPTKSSPST